MDTVAEITKGMAFVLRVDDPSPVAFINVYDEGDVWVKIQGCEKCPEAERIKCCGTCPCVLADGRCYWHAHNPHGHNGGMKPFHCIQNPLLTNCRSRCCIEYKCIEGPNVRPYSNPAF